MALTQVCLQALIHIWTQKHLYLKYFPQCVPFQEISMFQQHLQLCLDLDLDQKEVTKCPSHSYHTATLISYPVSTKLHTNNKWCKPSYVLLFSPLSCTLNVYSHVDVFQMIATVTTPSRLTLMHSRRTSRTRRRMSARWWKLKRTMSWLWQRWRWRWRSWSWRRWRWSSREASSRGGRIVPTIPAATLEPSLTLALCDYSKGLWLWCLLWGWLWLQWYWLWLLLLQVPWKFVSVLKNPCNNNH